MVTIAYFEGNNNFVELGVFKKLKTTAYINSLNNYEFIKYNIVHNSNKCCVYYLVNIYILFCNAESRILNILCN